MKTQQQAFKVVLASLGLAVASALGATTYNFSYEFAEHTWPDAGVQAAMTVSGTLTGDRVADFVENVSLVSVFFNQIESPGPFELKPGSVVSFNAEDNEFQFRDPSAYPEYQEFGTWCFGVSAAYNSAYAINYTAAWVWQDGTMVPSNFGETLVPERWSLTPAIPPIAFTGFLPPIGGADATGGSFDDPVRTFKLNSTIPIKFTATCEGAPVTTGVQTLQAIKWSSQTDSAPAIDATPTDAATTGNQFRSTNGEWHFNLDTKATEMSTGKWQLIATLSDGTLHSVWIQVK
jgi:hypothetical protein